MEYDQREALAEAKQQQHQPNMHGTSRSYRMMQAAIGRAAFSKDVLVLTDNRTTAYDLRALIPPELSRFITVRCIQDHENIDWGNWKVPGWEDHLLFVDHMVIRSHLPHLVTMLNY